MLEKVKRQEIFTTWPLHLTLVPWFEISGNNLSHFLLSMEKVCGDNPPLRLVAKDTDYFGPRKVKVTLIEPTEQLLTLHTKLVEVIYDCDAKLISAKHTRDDYRPHVTDRGEKGPARKELVIKQVHLVARGEKNDRQVVGVLNLNKA